MSNNTQKFLKKLLTTTSALAIIAGGANSSLAGGAGRNTGAGAVNLSTMGIAGPNDWVIFNGAATLTVDAGGPNNIAGIDVAFNPGENTVINNNISIGSISGVAGPMAIYVNNAQLLLMLTMLNCF